MPRRGSSRARRMPCPRGSPAGSCPGSRPRLASASPHREPGVIDGFRVHTLYPGGAAGGGERDKVGGGYAASATGSGAWTGTWCVVLGCTPKRHTRQSQPRATGEPEPPPPICPALRFWQRWDAATLTGPGAELLAVELAHAGQRDRGHDRDLPRVLVGGQVLPGVLGELGGGDLRGRARRHERDDLLAEPGVRPAHHSGLGD